MEKGNSNQNIKGTFFQFRVKRTKKEKDKEDTLEVDVTTKIPLIIFVALISAIAAFFAGC